MVRAYGEDLREKVIKSLGLGERKEVVAKNFKIGLSTVYRFEKLWKETGSVKSKKAGRKSYSHKIKDYEKFREFVEENSDLTQEQMGRLWECSEMTINRGLKKIGFTVKKRHMFTKNKT